MGISARPPLCGISNTGFKRAECGSGSPTLPGSVGVVVLNKNYPSNTQGVKSVDRGAQMRHGCTKSPAP
ncbi:hypothetical protein J6590_099477 [Homalodisca vitripennis]|nr:hypothetical protein J6590_099477 [Homalodisca vitripennis]